MIADFASHNTSPGIVKGKPTLVSENPADVIPDADVLLMPLPIFVYPFPLKDINPCLHIEQMLCIPQGQSGFELSAKVILVSELMSQIKSKKIQRGVHIVSRNRGIHSSPIYNQRQCRAS